MRISDWSSDVCSSDLLFVSALRPGQGLWPDDKWPDRNPLFEDDPDTDDLDDFNPNRIFTSKRLKPGEYFYDITLDNGKYVLTEGFQAAPEGSTVNEVTFGRRLSELLTAGQDYSCGVRLFTGTSEAGSVTVEKIGQKSWSGRGDK